MAHVNKPHFKKDSSIADKSGIFKSANYPSWYRSGVLLALFGTGSTEIGTTRVGFIEAGLIQAVFTGGADGGCAQWKCSACGEGWPYT
jgi:hypothetical protein